MQLRDYQLKVIDGLRTAYQQYHSVLAVLPTGAGKTIIAGHIVQQSILNKNNRTWFIVHRTELMEQTAEKFTLFQVNSGFISSETLSVTESSVIAMVQTLKNKIEKIPYEFLPDFIIVDEAHKIAANTYMNLIKTIRDRKPQVKLLGLTATPRRLDGKGLSDAFQFLVPGPTVRELIDLGQLSKYRIIAPPNDLDLSKIKITSFGEYNAKQLQAEIERANFFGDIITKYKEYLNNKQVIVFALNIAHSKQIAELFKMAGISAAHVDADTPKDERAQIIQDFKEGKYLVLTNVYLFAEGVDVPQLDGVIMARPTASETMYQQMAGRCLRLSEGKEIALLIDHVKNWEVHGMPCIDREWLLTYPKKKREKETTNKECPGPECFSVVPISTKICPYCGHEFTQDTSREIIKFDVDFCVYDPEGLVIRFKTKDERKQYINTELAKCYTQEDFVNLAIRVGNKVNWGRVQYAYRTQKRSGNSRPYQRRAV
jgi:superfamily II DNA or RNA helicase